MSIQEAVGLPHRSRKDERLFEKGVVSAIYGRIEYRKNRGRTMQDFT